MGSNFSTELNHRGALYWFAKFIRTDCKPIIPDPSHAHVLSRHVYARAAHVYW